MMEVQRAIAMRLPDGSHIKIETYGDERKDGSSTDHSWKALDISRIWPDEKEELLASVDYDETKGLRTLVYNGSQAEPIFTKEDTV